MGLQHLLHGYQEQCFPNRHLVLVFHGLQVGAAASATTASSSTTPTDCSMPPASITSRTCTRPISTSSSTPLTPQSSSRRRRTAYRSIGSRPPRSPPSTKWPSIGRSPRSEEHTSELQSPLN